MRMLQVSARAAAFVDEARRASGLPESAGIRLSTRGDTGGHALQVKLATAPDEGDDVVEREGANVFVAPELRELVSGRLLELEHRAEQPHLILRSRDGNVS
jgi:iron-sulfur cluster assembly protein